MIDVRTVSASNSAHLSWIDEPYYKKTIDHILELAHNMGATQAEVAAQCSLGLNLTVRMNEIETLQFNQDKSFGVHVYVNQHKGSASTTDLSADALKQAVQAAIDIARYTEQDTCAGLADSQQMADMSTLPDLDLYHPWDLSVEQAKNLALECEAAALSYDERIKNSEGASVSKSQMYHIYGNSHGFRGGYLSSMHSLSCVVIGEGEKGAQGMQRDYQYTVSRNAQHLVEAPRVGREAAWRTIQRLNPRKIDTQNTPVLFHAGIASSLINHFLSAIEGGALCRKTSFLLDALETAVFNTKINIIESPHILGGLYSAPFDSEGVATQARDLISEGILQTYLLNAYSARKLKLKNTGHAGGTHNILVYYMNPEKPPTFEQLLKKMDKGLLVTEVMGQGVNPVTGDYSKGAAGFWVENGEIQYPVNEITIAGNLKQMYQQIVDISSDDVDFRRNVQTGSILIENMMVAGS